MSFFKDSEGLISSFIYASNFIGGMNDETQDGAVAELYCAHNPNKKFCSTVVENVYKIKKMCISYLDQLVSN